MEDKLDKLEQNRSFTPAEAQETPEETPDPFVKLEARYQELDEKIQKYCSPEERARIRTAFEFARDSHQGQLRKDGSPYITHPLEVAHLVAELGLDSDSIMAALLHDTIEDTEATQTLQPHRGRPGGGGHQAHQNELRLHRGEADGEPAQDAYGHGQGCAGDPH